jgi:hypothetical protein
LLAVCAAAVVAKTRIAETESEAASHQAEGR